MKRNKIKPKYMMKITNNVKDINIDKFKDVNSNYCDNTINDTDNVIKGTKLQIISISKFLGLLLLLLCWSLIPVILLLLLFGINYYDFSATNKIIYAALCDITFLVFIMYIYRRDLINDFKNFFNNNFISNILQSFKYWGLGLLVMITSNIIISIVTNGGIAANEQSVRDLIDKAPIYMIFQIAVYAPITEELIFRKSLINVFNNKYFYIMVSGILFGGMHIILSLSSVLDLLYLIPYCSLGIALAALYNKTNNIFSTISIHSFHNILTFCIYLIGRM